MMRFVKSRASDVMIGMIWWAAVIYLFLDRD